MALTGKLTFDVGVQTPATKFFNLIAKQLHQVQNIAENVHHTQLHQGDDWHSNDAVKHWTYTIDGKVVSAKESIEAIDEQNKSITFNVFDGDVTPQFKTFKFNLQVVDKDHGGAIAKWIIDYEKVNEGVAPPNGYVEYLTSITRDVDAHLAKAA